RWCPGRGGDPRGDRFPETHPPDHRRRGGLPSQFHSGLPTPERSLTIPGRLGGLRPRGTVLGFRQGHPGSFSHRGLPLCPSRSARTP
ncbi:hypothetical protein M9458_045874, partial [Cirrhinus mrigala]